MKIYTDTIMSTYKLAFKTPQRVLEHAFATLGNGVTGEVIAEYNRMLPLGHSMIPVPLDGIYPWSETLEFQPFRKLVGAEKYPVDFRNSWFWFLDCLAVSDDSDPDIAEWQKQLPWLRTFNFYG